MSKEINLTEFATAEGGIPFRGFTVTKHKDGTVSLRGPVGDIHTIVQYAEGGEGTSWAHFERINDHRMVAWCKASHGALGKLGRHIESLKPNFGW